MVVIARIPYTWDSCTEPSTPALRGLHQTPFPLPAVPRGRQDQAFPLPAVPRGMQDQTGNGSPCGIDDTLTSFAYWTFVATSETYSKFPLDDLNISIYPILYHPLFKYQYISYSIPPFIFWIVTVVTMLKSIWIVTILDSIWIVIILETIWTVTIFKTIRTVTFLKTIWTVTILKTIWTVTILKTIWTVTILKPSKL